MPAAGQTRTSSLGPHVRFRRVQTLVREGSPLVKLRNSAWEAPLRIGNDICNKLKTITRHSRELEYRRHFH